MNLKTHHRLVCLVMTASCSVASAAPVQIVAFEPESAYFNGAGGDDQSPENRQLFSEGGYAGYKVTSIEWWGGYLSPAQSNAFTIEFNRVRLVSEVQVTQVQIGLLPTPPDPNEPQQDVPLYRYSLDTSGLSIVIRDLADTDDDNELFILSTLSEVGSNWFWQYAVAGAPQLSYRIFGEQVVEVPEPSSALLVALAGFGLLATRRRQA